MGRKVLLDLRGLLPPVFGFGRFLRRFGDFLFLGERLHLVLCLLIADAFLGGGLARGLQRLLGEGETLLRRLDRGLLVRRVPMHRVGHRERTGRRLHDLRCFNWHAGGGERLLRLGQFSLRILPRLPRDIKPGVGFP